MEPACMNGRQSTKLAAYIAVSRPPSFKRTPRNLKNTCTCAVLGGESASLPIIYRHVCVRLSGVSDLAARARVGGRFMSRPEMASDHDFNHQRIRLARTRNLIFSSHY